MPASIFRAAALAAGILATLATSPASGFDGLERILRMVPALDPAKRVALLSYARLNEAMDGAVRGVDTGGVAEAYHLKDEFRGLFGVDITELREQAIIGEPPSTLTYVVLDRARIDELTAALRKRGFEREVIGVHHVYVRGVDYGFDMRNRRPADPFGGALGASQRILVRDDAIVVARGWPDMRAAMAALDGARPPVTAVLAAAIPALRDAVGPGAVASQAVLYGVPAFAGATLDRETMDAIMAGRAPSLPRSPPGGGMPPFVAAWLVAGVHGKNAFAAIAAIYVDEDLARRGASAIAHRLKEFRPGDGPTPTYEVKISPADSAWVGVVIARFADQPLASGVSMLSRWHGAVNARAFTPLDPLR